MLSWWSNWLISTCDHSHAVLLYLTLHYNRKQTQEMTGGTYLLEHLLAFCSGHFLFWPKEGTLCSLYTLPDAEPGGGELRQCGVLSELSALISAVSLKWCQLYSISSKMNSCPAWRPSQRLNFATRQVWKTCRLTCYKRGAENKLWTVSDGLQSCSRSNYSLWSWIKIIYNPRF